MSHLRIGIVGDYRPRSILVALLMGRHRMDDIFVISRHDGLASLNNEVIALEVLHMNIPRAEMPALALEHTAVSKISLAEVFKTIEFAEEFVLPERGPLPRPPKSICPKGTALKRLVMQRGVPRNR